MATINGAASNQSQSAMQGMLTIKNANHTKSQISALQMTTRKTEPTIKKRLNYNHREISGQLLRSKKAQSASGVLTRAKSRLANLQRQAGSGQYDDKEIANAIAHARRMVRCAQLKVSNLKEEEQERKARRKESGEREQQKKNEVKRRVAQREREIEQKVAIEKMQIVAKEKRKRTEMAQKRRVHRNQEQARINEADMKYIKGMMENNGSGGNTVQGAVLDLSMEASMMAEVQMLEAQIGQQVEAQVEAEVAAEFSTEMAMSDGMAAGGVSDGMDVETSNAEVGNTVDISI